MVGVWGSGKSKVSGLVAAALNWRFVDSDCLIDDFVEAVRRQDHERLAERSRRLERLITSGPRREPCVIATNLRPLLQPDGDLPPSIRTAIAEGRCIIIELVRDLQEIAEFLATNEDERRRRPNMIGTSAAELRNELQHSLNRLAPVYRKYGSLQVAVAGDAFERAAADVLSAIRGEGLAT